MVILSAFFLVVLTILTGCSVEKDQETVSFSSSSPSMPTSGFAPAAQPARPPSGDDHGNTRENATSIALNDTIEATLENDDDVDVFQIELRESGFLTVQTEGDTDTQGTLLDSSGNRIARAFDRSLSDLNFQIDEFLEAGTYFVEVARDFLATPGPYTLATIFSTVVEATFTLECETVECPFADEISTFTGQVLEIVRCQWPCANFEGQTDIFVSLTFERELDGGCFERADTFVSGGACFP